MSVKETDRKVTASVSLRQDARLEYTVIAKGDTPMFTLSDSAGGTIMTSKNQSPMKVYTTSWLAAGNPSGQHTITGLFVAATKYTYQVVHHKGDGSKELIIDIDYDQVDPKDPKDKFMRALTVNVKKQAAAKVIASAPKKSKPSKKKKKDKWGETR